MSTIQKRIRYFFDGRLFEILANPQPHIINYLSPFPAITHVLEMHSLTDAGLFSNISYRKCVTFRNLINLGSTA